MLRSHPKNGRIWLTRCDCGNYREVAAVNFTSGRVRKCELCVDPAKRAMQPKLNERRAELRNQWFRPDFKASWREQMDGFDPLEWLLFEAILDERDRSRCAIVMQAVDIVLRARPHIDIEIGSFGQKRIARAIERVKARGIELGDEVTPSSFLFE